MRRGDVVLVREPGTPATKARPCVVIQRDSVIPNSDKLTVCPITSTLRGPEVQRPLVAPSAENGLRSVSQVEVDWLYTFRLDRFDKVIGHFDTSTMNAIDAALRRWLDI